MHSYMLIHLLNDLQSPLWGQWRGRHQNRGLDKAEEAEIPGLDKAGGGPPQRDDSRISLDGGLSSCLVGKKDREDSSILPSRQKIPKLDDMNPLPKPPWV